MMVRCYVRKEFIQRAPCGTLVLALSHELSHIALRAIGHSLLAVEEAVDLTAMFLGFKDYFIKYSIYESDTSTFRIGYLTREEYVYAASLMARD